MDLISGKLMPLKKESRIWHYDGIVVLDMTLMLINYSYHQRKTIVGDKAYEI